MMQNQHKKTVRETAIAWFLRMQQVDFEHADRSKFEAWLMQTPAHQQAYKEVTLIWEGFDSTAELKSLDAAMEQKNFQDQILAKQKRTRKIGQSITTLLSIAIIAFAGLFGYRTWQAQPLSETVKIAQVGQIKQETLEDGTKLNMNANSELEVIYFRDRRIAKLKKGEVIFDVARDESRPFIVDSGYGRITVLGTRFAVNRLQKIIRVSVDHGRVQVESLDVNGNVIATPLILNNGEVAEVRQQQTPKRTDQLASDAFSFEQGSITFDKAGLEEIAETLSRYRKPAVTVQTLPTEDAQITAVIKTQEVEKFIATLPDIAAVKVKSSPDATVIIGQPGSH